MEGSEGAMPPREDDVANLTVDTKTIDEQLQKGLEHIYEMEDPADRQIGFYNLREEVGIKNEKMWNAVIWSLEQQERTRNQSQILGERLSLRQNRSHQQSKGSCRSVRSRCWEQTQAPARQCSCIGWPRPRLTGRNLWASWIALRATCW